MFTEVDSPRDLDGREIHIEFREMPEVISDLMEIDYVRQDEDGHKRLKISRFTERGITFYTPYPSGDGFIFVPYSEVRSLYTLSSSDFEAIKQDVQSLNVQAATTE